MILIFYKLSNFLQIISVKMSFSNSIETFKDLDPELKLNIKSKMERDPEKIIFDPQHWSGPYLFNMGKNCWCRDNSKTKISG